MNAKTPCLALALLAGLFATACAPIDAGEADSDSVFRHGLNAGNTPWNHADFDNADDKFSFAVFSDLTGGEREGIFQIAVAQLSLLHPELILGVGDLIEGGTTDQQQLEREWNSFDERADKARAPLFYVGGNHDLTNMVMREFWERRYGARYYHFVYKDVLFLILDTEDNSPERMQEIFLARAEAIRLVDEQGWDVFGQTEYAQMPEQESGAIGVEQAAYFEKVIAGNPQVRWTFLFMHKAAWKKQGEQNFAAIENALSGQPYTVFHGHEHAYLHEERLGRDYIRLGTTGGVQFVDRDLSLDHVTWVTVSRQGVDIANLKMSGIFDKQGQIPLGGDEVCFDTSECAESD